MKLTLQRQGTFSVGECGDDTTQCGMRGSRKLNYHVSISSTEKQLDDSGFIIDNNEIQQYFDARFYSVDRFPLVRTDRLSGDDGSTQAGRRASL
jgi:hypothetical protein